MADNDGGTLKITDTYLKDFATQKLQPFLEDLKSDPHRTELDSYTQSGALGHDVGWNYNQLLTGNSKGNFAAAARLQSDFKTFATALSQRFTDIETAAQTLIEDLKMVDVVLTKGEDAADITASEMNADLTNVSFSSGGPSGPGPGPTGPGSSNPGN